MTAPECSACVRFPDGRIYWACSSHRSRRPEQPAPELVPEVPEPERQSGAEPKRLVCGCGDPECALTFGSF